MINRSFYGESNRVALDATAAHAANDLNKCDRAALVRQKKTFEKRRDRIEERLTQHVLEHEKG